MKQKGTTIQEKLMRIVLITSGTVVFLTCTAFVFYQFYAFKQNAKTQLFTLGEIVAANSTAALAFQDHDDATENLQVLNAQKHIVAACLYDTNGHVFAKYPDTVSIQNLARPPLFDIYSYKGTNLDGFQQVKQRDIWVGTLYLKADVKGIYQTLTQYVVIGVLVLALAIAVAYILSRRLQRQISEPILALSRTAETVSQEKNYSLRAKKFDNDELGLLTDAINNMLDRIEAQNDEIISFSVSMENKVKQRTMEVEQANVELKLQTELSLAIIDSSVDVIAVFDKELKFVVLNKYGREIYHVREEDVIGKSVLAVFPSLENGQMINDLSRALDGEAVHNPYYYSSLSNSVLENFFIPLRDRNNNVYGVLVIGHDITAIVEGNEKLKSANISLEQSNRDLEQFAYIASHDLQEPLRKIQMFSSRLASTLDDKETATQYLGKISASATRMSDLIKAVLQYSRLAGENLEFETVNLQDVFHNILTDFDLLIAEKDAEIIADPLPEVVGNKFQLSQLLSNFLSNSLKFSKQKPRVRISSTIVAGNLVKPFNGHNENIEYALLEFRDNGIGFSPEHYQRVFTVFQRLHSKDEYPGTGIGLALCKKIVDNHHGHISVTSRLGEGTTFSVYLPMTRIFVQQKSVAEY